MNKQPQPYRKKLEQGKLTIQLHIVKVVTILATMITFRLTIGWEGGFEKGF